MIKKILTKISNITYIKKAIQEKANLSTLKEKPTLRVYIGIGIILFSYAIGWPAVGLLILLSVVYKEPLLATIGGPLIYGFSHLVFWFGVFLAGKRYIKVISRWSVRKVFEKYYKGK